MGQSRGFTLIELVIVLAIIGIFASLAVPKYTDIARESKISASKAGLGAIRALMATRYAASATGGAVASYPTYIAATDFANREIPRNVFNPNASNPATLLAAGGTFMGTQAGSWSYWYVTNSGSADYGKVGAFSDGVLDTSSW